MQQSTFYKEGRTMQVGKSRKTRKISHTTKKKEEKWYGMGRGLGAAIKFKSEQRLTLSPMINDDLFVWEQNAHQFHE